GPRRCFPSPFLALWWQACRLRSRHACQYSFRLLLCLRWRCLFLLFRFRFLFFFFLFFFLLLFFRRFFAFTTDKSDSVPHVYLAAFLDINLREGSVLGRFPFHCRFIGLNLRQHFAGRNLIALLFFPCDESALRHRVA